MSTSELVAINVEGVEDWREYDFSNRVYRIDKPTMIQFRPGGTTHRVTDSAGIVHIVPAPGHDGCVLRFSGTVIA